MADLKNIIFDFGGVIIDLHMDRTFHAFSKLSGIPTQEIINSYLDQRFLFDYEMGLISDEEFRVKMAEYLKIPLQKQEIDAAWNEMLGIIPVSRISRIKWLSEKYRVYLLSNTNAIHEVAFNQILRNSTGVNQLDDLFHQTFYSHKINLRKPSKDIYNHVLSEGNLNPEESVFLDDTLENVNAALSVGMNAIQIKSPDQWLTYWNE